MKKLLIFALTLMLILPFAGANAQLGSTDPELYITEDGAFSVFLPTDWIAQGTTSGLFVGNTETALDVDTMVAGDLFLLVLPFGVAEMEDQGMDPAEATHEDILEYVETAFFPGLEFDEEEGTLGQDDNAPVALYASGADEDFDVLLVAFSLTLDTYGIAAIATVAGEMEDFRDGALQTLQTVHYSYALDADFENADGDFVFSYPEGWSVGEAETEGFYAIGNSEEAMQALIDDVDEASPSEGQSWLGVLDVTDLELDLTEETLAPTLMELANSIIEGATDNPVLGEPIIQPVGDYQIAIVSYSSDNAEGALMVSSGEGGAHVVVYFGLPGEGRQLYLIALNMMLSAIAPVEEE